MMIEMGTVANEENNKKRLSAVRIAPLITLIVENIATGANINNAMMPK